MNIKIDPRISESISVTKTSTPPSQAKNLKDLRESTREFEAIYINEMYKAMRKSVPEDGLFKTDSATKMYQEMMDMELARTTANGKGMGLGEAMFDQLKDKIK